MGLEQLIEHQTQPGISGKTSRQTLPMIHLFILVDGEAGMKGVLVESTRQLLFQKKGYGDSDAHPFSDSNARDYRVGRIDK